MLPRCWAQESFPKPTSGWTFTGGGKQPTTGKEELVRIDHQFSDKFSIFGHWISDQADAPTEPQYGAATMYPPSETLSAILRSAA